MQSLAGFAVVALLAASPGVGSDRPLGDPAASLTEMLRLQRLDDLDRPSPEDSPFALAYEDQVRLHAARHLETRVRVVGPVFTEYLHILVRTPIQVQRPEDLSHLRIWVAQPDGGRESLTELFLDHVGLPLPLLSRRITLPGPEARILSGLSNQFRADHLDVALVAAVPGYQPLCEGMKEGTHALVPLDYETLRSLAIAPDRSTGIQRPIRVDYIPPDTYFGQRDPVPTVSRSLLLVTRDGVDGDAADARLRDARTAWAQFPQSAHGMSCGPDLAELPAGLKKASDLEWLPGQPPNAGWAKAGRWALGTLVMLVLLGLLVLAWRRGVLTELRSYWAQDKLPFVILLTLALSIAAITVGTYLFERDINENFLSIRESFWSITIYLFSGLEDRTPYTQAGRFTATLGLLLGPAFFAVMSGYLARFFIRREKKMPQNLRDHYLLLNWNERAVNVVREIHHPVLLAHGGPSVIVLLTDREDLSLQQLKEAGSGRDEAFEDFYLSIGDPTSERGLLNANAQDARTVVIFADEKEGDERTFRSVFVLRRIARERGLRNMHVVAELLDPANTSILDEMALDFPGLLERVSNTEIRTYLLAQAAMSPGLVGFYTDLLRTTGDTNELYTLAVPDGAAGTAFSDYAAFVLKADLPESLIPVGIRRMVDGRVRMLTNPRPRDPDSVLRSGDYLLVFAYEPPTPDILPVPPVACHVVPEAEVA
jgi:hypothetical protein